MVVDRTFCDTGSVPLPRNGPPPTRCSLESCLLAWKHQALFLLVLTTRSHPRPQGGAFSGNGCIFALHPVIHNLVTWKGLSPSHSRTHLGVRCGSQSSAAGFLFGKAAPKMLAAPVSVLTPVLLTNATCFDPVHEPCLSEPQADLYFICVHMYVYNVYMNLYILSIKSSLL